MRDTIQEAMDEMNSLKREFSFLSNLLDFNEEDVLLIFVGISTYFAFSHFIITNTQLNIPNTIISISYVVSIVFAVILSKRKIFRKINSLIGFFLSIEVMILITTYTKNSGFDPLLIIHGIFFIFLAYKLYETNIK